MAWTVLLGALGLCLVGSLTLVIARWAYVRICRLRARTPAPSHLVQDGSVRRRILLGAPYAILVGALEIGVLFLIWVVFLEPGPITGDVALARSARLGLRMLLIGDSLIGANDLGTMVRDLGQGWPGGPPLYVVQYAVDGATLAQSEKDPALQELLNGVRWDDVVLQDNSNVVDDPLLVQSMELPAVQSLTGRGAHTILFEPWPHHNGDSRYPGDSMWRMLLRIDDLESWMQHQVPGIEVGLVGKAWGTALGRDPGLALWSDDVHPSVMGSYLAACELFADVTGFNPGTSTYTAGLGVAVAHRLAGIAWQTFLQYRPARF